MAIIVRIARYRFIPHLPPVKPEYIMPGITNPLHVIAASDGRLNLIS
jgi:hypothetical protein